jgi:hypothetical protein
MSYNRTKYREEDSTPVDQIIVRQDGVTHKDPEYKKKLEYSYFQCLTELCNPEPDWEDAILETKFTIDENTGHPINYHVFDLTYPDDIRVGEGVNHSYIFKRSHFYSSFGDSDVKTSRLRRDLVTFWKKKDYYVNLYKDPNSNKWKLKISWGVNRF